jgi:secretion/DNA translocation related TadE-like protein
MPRGERGAGSVLVLGAMGAVVTVLGGGLVAAAGLRDVHLARAAADLAALAAARSLTSGGAADCAAAARVAAANGGALTWCRGLPDGTVVVRVGVAASWPRGWTGLPGSLSGTARAGPDVVPP